SAGWSSACSASRRSGSPPRWAWWRSSSAPWPPTSVPASCTTSPFRRHISRLQPHRWSRSRRGEPALWVQARTPPTFAQSVRRGVRLVVIRIAVHILQVHALGFFHPPPHEESRQHCAQGIEPIRKTERLAQGGERHGDRPVRRPLARGGKAQRGRPDAVREHLAEQHPYHRPP